METLRPVQVPAGYVGYGTESSTLTAAIGVLSLISSGVCAYHGYKRNCDSIGWAVGWGLLGGVFPVIAPVVAVVQGVGKPSIECRVQRKVLGE
jgi:hypothetical protein